MDTKRGGFDLKDGLGFLPGMGEMATRIRTHPWAATPLGPPERWPQALKTVVGVAMNAKQPMAVVWGAERTLLYNDGYAEILAGRHPAALGRPLLDVWSEIRDNLRSIVERAYAGEATRMDGAPFLLERCGSQQETCFSFTYTPVRDEKGTVAGLFCVCTEIMQQIAAERWLASETERQRRLFEQAPGFIAILTGPEHVFEFVNQAFRRLVGDRDCIGRSAREAFPELEDQGLFDHLDRVYATGERFVAEDIPVRLQRSPGAAPEEHFLNFIYEPVTDAAGQVTGIFCEGYDVTETHLGQAALAASEERFRAFVTASSDVVYRMSPDWTQMRQLDGRGFLSDTAQPDEDWLRNYIHPDDRPMVQAAIEKAIRTKSVFELEHRVRRADGTLGWTLSRAVPILDGNGEITEWLGSARDVTSRREAEVAERRLAAIIASSGDAIISKDLDGIVTSWNQGAERLFGYRAEEAIGKPITIVIPEDRLNEETGILERSGQGEYVEHFETVRRRKDGSLVEVLLTISPIRDRNGRIVGASKIARDITERKRLEEQLLLVNRELHHRVKNTLATVQAVISATARRAQSIAEFQNAVTTRIASLAKTHTLLIAKGHSGASLRDILSAELAPYDDGTGQRVRLAGPDVRLPSEVAVAFGMAVHELTTNAAKYGAFSLPTGSIEAAWDLEEQAGECRLTLTWREQGGPPVKTPERQGFGSVLLQRALGRQLGGEVETNFAPDGLQVRISAMLPPQ